MPTYRFRCGKGHVWEEWRPLSRFTREVDCDCGMVGRLVMTSPAIASAALPNKASAQDARMVNAREKRWDRDMDAYYRLRKQGIQPRGIDGAAVMEQFDTKTEIEMGRRLPKHAAWVGSEVSSEMLGKAVGELA